MAEYLEKEGLKKSITSLLYIEKVAPNIKQLVIDIIDGEMLADVQPIVYAHKTINVGRRSYCSNCGKLAIMEDYCSKCGAKVRDGDTNGY